MEKVKSIKAKAQECAEQLRNMENRISLICQKVDSYIQGNGSSPKLKEKSKVTIGKSKPEKTESSLNLDVESA